MEKKKKNSLKSNVAKSKLDINPEQSKQSRSFFFLLNCYNFSYREVSFIYNHNAYAILKTYLTGEKLIPHLFESWGQGYYYYYVDGCSTIYDI